MPSEELIATAQMIREAQMFSGAATDVSQMREAFSICTAAVTCWDRWIHTQNLWHG